MAEKTSWPSSQNSIRDSPIISQPIRYPKLLFSGVGKGRRNPSIVVLNRIATAPGSARFENFFDEKPD
jgi:hypothetical protein